MKRILALTLAALLICGAASAQAEEYYSIVELRRQTPEWLTQTYETKWRTVDIDTPVIVPDGDSFPIVTVVPDWWTITPTDPQIKVDTDRMLRDAPVNQFTLRKGEMAEIKANSDDFKHAHLFAPYVPTDEVLPGAMSIQNAINMIGNMLASANMSDLFDFENPKEIHGQFIPNKDGSVDLCSCSVSIDIPFLLHGLPVLRHVGFAAGENLKDGELIVSTGCTGTIQPSTGAIMITGRMYSESEILADDVPLCSFDRVKENIVQKIEDGLIRKIFSIELGYALYNEPGSKRSPGASYLQDATFYAVPTWFVQCLYEKDVKKDLPAYDGEDDMGGRNSIKMKWLAFNAQTGEMLSRKKSKVRTADYTGFMTWEEVR